MARVLAAALAAATLILPAAAAPEWIKLESPNFVLYTSDRQGDARQTITLFEQVRDFFMRVKSQNVTTQLAVTIVGFRNAKEFAPYRPNEFAAAYFIGDEQRDYIVMSDLGSEHTPTAIHEYMHLLVRHSGLKMPVWLNEGFAEVYSTLKPVSGQMLLGSVPAGRASVLAGSKWLPIGKLVNIEHESPEYNEKDRAGLFYAQSWLLVHMLMLGEDYKDGFTRFVAAVHDTGSAEKAFETAYKKKIWEVEVDLRKYYGSARLTGILYKSGYEKIKVEPARPATDVEVGITLAKLTALLRNYEEAARRFSELAAASPDNPEIEEALAHLAWRRSNREEAVEHFARAIKLGASSWKTYWDYARLLGPGEDVRGYTDALRKALERKPDLLDARLALGSALLQQQSWAQAFALLHEVKNIDPDRASRLFLMLAYSSLNLDKRAEAKTYAADAKKYAKDPHDRDSAERLISVLEREPAPRERSAAVVMESDDETRPRIARRAGLQEPPPDIPATGPKRVTVQGNFKRLDCLGEMARIHVMDGRETFLLLIRKPDAVTIRGGSGTMDMKCGPQNAAVVVEYLPAKDETTHTVGEVRVIEFIE